HHGATGEIIQIDGLYISHIQIVEIVVTDDVAPFSIILSHVDGAGIARLQADMMDLVIFEDVLIAAQNDGAMRSVVDQVVCYAVANAGYVDTGGVGPRPLAKIMYAVVD